MFLPAKYIVKPKIEEKTGFGLSGIVSAIVAYNTRNNVNFPEWTSFVWAISAVGFFILFINLLAEKAIYDGNKIYVFHLVKTEEIAIPNIHRMYIRNTANGDFLILESHNGGRVSIPKRYENVHILMKILVRSGVDFDRRTVTDYTLLDILDFLSEFRGVLRAKRVAESRARLQKYRGYSCKKSGKSP